MSPEDRAAISGLIAGQDEAWNRGDAAAHAAPVLEGCVFTNIFGQVFVGREAFERQHAAIFSTVYAGSRVEQVIDHARLVRPDVALVDSSATLRVAEGPSGPARTVETKLAQVLVRGENGWGIASYHNVEMRPRPSPR